MYKENPVLVAEDDPNDSLFLQMAFESAGVRRKVIVVRDGRQVIDYLSGDREEHPRPCLMILDINMPRLSGLEVLEWLQGQEEFRTIPTLMLSSSGQLSDVERAMKWGAREFFTKPTNFVGLQALVRSINHLWIEPHCGGGVMRPAEPAHAC
jgi:DNA-binding response OmpR family regulator